MLDNFTDEATAAMKIAREVAVASGSPELDAMHILIGVCRAKGSLAARVLLACGQDPTEVCVRAQALLPSAAKTRGDAENPPFTASAKMALETAADEAVKLGHSRVDTDHMLLALLRLKGPVSQLLTRGGLKLLDARGRSLQIHRAGPPLKRAPLGRGAPVEEPDDGNRFQRITSLRKARKVCLALEQFDMAAMLGELADWLELGQ